MLYNLPAFCFVSHHNNTPSAGTFIVPTDDFFVGGALGVDMWAGEQLLALKEKSGYENIEIIVAIPFVGHDSKWQSKVKKG